VDKSIESVTLTNSSSDASDCASLTQPSAAVFSSFFSAFDLDKDDDRTIITSVKPLSTPLVRDDDLTNFMSNDPLSTLSI